jgi:hypothetical protein
MANYQQLNRQYNDVLQFLQRELQAMSQNGLDSSRVTYSLEILQGGINEISDLVAQAEHLSSYQSSQYRPGRAAMVTPMVSQMQYTRSPFTTRGQSISSRDSGLGVTTRSRSRPRVGVISQPIYQPTYQPSRYQNY